MEKTTELIGKCPLCGSGNIDYDNIDYDNNYDIKISYLIYKAVCLDCNAEIEEFYNINYSHTVGNLI